LNEAAIAQSLFQSDSDVEILLLFDIGRLDATGITECEDYVAEYCQQSGWEYRITTSSQSKVHLRLIIPLGGEDTNKNNYQSLSLDHKVSLLIDKSGVRKKNTQGKNAIMLFPARVHRSQQTSESTKPINIHEHPEDYSMLLLTSPETSQSTSIWFFPRQSTQWVHPEVSLSPPGGTPLNEMQIHYQQLHKASWMTGSILLMAIKGCLSDFGNQTLDKVQHYLHELGYEVHDMPADNYCGWHAIVRWIRTNRPDLAPQISDTDEGLTASTVFNFFRDRARKIAKEKDSKTIFTTISEMMSASHSQATWLDDLQLNYLVAPFVQENILVFDTGAEGIHSDLPFQVNLIEPDAGLCQLSSSQTVENAINEHSNSIMLVHNTNHWLLITHNETHENTAEEASSPSTEAVMAPGHYNVLEDPEPFSATIEAIIGQLSNM
jgi:hypothetical protein